MSTPVCEPSAAERLDFLLETLSLKAVPRKGWVDAGVGEAEDVAAHSWGVAWLVLHLLPASLSLEKALAYAIIHDVAEVRTGDITPHDGLSPEAKHALEREAVAGLARHVQGRWVELWHAYESQTTPEARFVRQLDRLDMALQAWTLSAQTGRDLSAFVQSAQAVIDHPALTPLFAELKARMDALNASR